jgi:two-component system sensor histidine kinase UhpB
MRERALLVGGSLTIFSQPGKGTTVELTMGTP